MLWATNSLPVPVSPTTSTSTPESATCSIVSKTLRIAGQVPTMSVEAIGAFYLPAEQIALGGQSALLEQTPQ